LIGQIRLSQDRIAAFVTDRYFELHPACAHADSPRVRRLCHEDTAHHLDQLCYALELGDTASFDAYLAWLRSVLTHRQLPLEHTVDALSLIRDWIAANIPHADAKNAVAIIEHGTDLFMRGEPASAQGSSQIASQHALQTPSAAPTAAVTDYTNALVSGYRDTAVRRVVEAMARGASLVDVSVDLVQPALYQIGKLWEHNCISVAQEHLATAITQNALAAGFARAEFREPNGRSAVFACVEDNHHGIGVRMVSDAFEVAGWDVSFLGTNTPTPAIVSFVAETNPNLLGLSAGLAHHVITLRDVIARVRAEMGNSAPQIIIGGLPLGAHRGSVLRLGADECFFDAREAVRASE
jgi:methanogenic corrinoid protein MtbC1